MSQIIEQFIRTHETILKTLEEVKQQKISSEESKRILLEAKAVLLNHLSEEDIKLYPVLEKEAQNNHVLKSTLNTFAKDLVEITSEVSKLYDMVDKNNDAFELSKQFGSVFTKLTTRIRREENILYKEYDKIIENQN